MIIKIKYNGYGWRYGRVVLEKFRCAYTCTDTPTHTRTHAHSRTHTQDEDSVGLGVHTHTHTHLRRGGDSAVHVPEFRHPQRIGHHLQCHGALCIGTGPRNARRQWHRGRRKHLSTDG